MHRFGAGTLSVLLPADTLVTQEVQNDRSDPENEKDNEKKPLLEFLICRAALHGLLAAGSISTPGK
jgi:hypothetical protein